LDTHFDQSTIHEYNNGVKCLKSTIYDVAIDRYNSLINLHEPFEECVFVEVFNRSTINTFVDVGAAWGYYSFLCKLHNPTCKVWAFDPDQEMCDNIKKNEPLNIIGEPNIEAHNEAISESATTLKSVIESLGVIDLIKIDIQGEGTSALLSAEERIVDIKNVILGTHGVEHDYCKNILEMSGFDIKLSLRANEIPIQPDGIIWADRKE